MSKFQQHTAVMKFFRDLRDEQDIKQKRFEQAETEGRPSDLSQTVFSYDIRREPVLTLKDEADRNLLYNIAQFLLDSRASLASRLEDQRVRQSLPDGSDFFRVCLDLEGVMRHFQVRRTMKRYRCKSPASPSGAQPKEPTSPALSDYQLPTNGASSPFSGSLTTTTTSASVAEGHFATGIDQQTFVDVFTEILRQEADRIVNREGDILSSSVTAAMAAAGASVAQGDRSVDAAGVDLPGLPPFMGSLAANAATPNWKASAAAAASAGRRPSAAAITFSGVFVAEETNTADEDKDDVHSDNSGPAPSHRTSPTRSMNDAAAASTTGTGRGGPSLAATVTSSLSPTSQTKRLMSTLSTVGGRTERRLLMKLFDDMDVDSCGVVSWDDMISYMARVRVGGQDRIEEQREGQLCLTRSEGGDPIRVGSGKAATAASVQYIPELGAILVIYERVAESSYKNEDAAAEANAKKPPPRRHRSREEADEDGGGGGATAADGGAEGHKVLELYATQDHRLMHRRLMPPSTTVVMYLPLVDDDSNTKKKNGGHSGKPSSGGSGGGGGFFGAFMSSGSFQAFRMQIQLARGTIDLIPSHNPVQLGGTHSPAYALYNSATNLVFCASLHGTLFAYDPQVLSRPMRISAPQRLHTVFGEPITCMISSPDSTKLFLSCLFGGIALYQPLKDAVTHTFSATYGNRREACGIRTMAYIAESNVLITAGPASSIEVWMATPCRGVDPHICTLEHESDPHRHDVMCAWVDPSISDRCVVSLDKSGVMKLWDVTRGLVLGSSSVGDGLGYHVFSAAAATNVKGTLYFVGNSTRTHRCFLDNVVMRRKMINPVAVARMQGVQHHRSCKLICREEQILSAVDGTVMTYDVKSGRMVQFFPNIFGNGHKRIAVMAAASSDDATCKKAFVATEDGDITTFCLLSGERRLLLKPFRNKMYEVTGLVYFDAHRVLVATCKRRSGDSTSPMQDPAIRVYSIPERDPPKGETQRPLDVMVEVTVPGKRGIAAVCERTHPTSATCGLVVMWDTSGYMYQLSVEGSRVLLSTALDAPREIVKTKPTSNAVVASGALHDTVVERASGGAPSSRASSAADTSGVPLSAAEINFASETAILTLLEDTVQDAQREVKCGVDLHPFPFVASSDSASRMHLWTAAPLDLFRVKSWEHFSPRKVVAGVNKAVVTALAFTSSSESSSSGSDPTLQLRLVAADDHGCVSVWDLTAFLEAAMGTAGVSAPSLFGDAILRGRRGSQQGSYPLHNQSAAANASALPTFKMGDVDHLFGAVEIPLLHCFHICPIGAPAEPLISIEVMASREAYCVGMSLGSTRFVSMTGSVVGELQADPKFMIEDPPKYFLDKIAEVEEMKKPKKRTRAGELWAKLRQSLLGDGRVLMLGVKELLSRARNATDLASKNVGESDDSDDEDGRQSPRKRAARNVFDEDEDDENDAANTTTTTSSSARHKNGRFDYASTPCNTPTEVRDVLNTLRVPTDARHTECLIDPSRSDTNRHPALKARRDVISLSHTAEEDSMAQSMAASFSASRAADQSTSDATMDLLKNVKKTLERLVDKVAKKPQTGIVTSTSLSKCYSAPPPLFAPSVFKALRRPEVALPPPEDRPLSVQPWIEQWIRLLNPPRSSSAPSSQRHIHHHHQVIEPVVWTAQLVPQQTMPLEQLQLPNHLAAKYWNALDEDDTVPRLKLKGCVDITGIPPVTPMPTHRRSTVVTARGVTNATTNINLAGNLVENGATLSDAPLVQQPAQRPLSALRRKLRDVPSSLADFMIVGGRNPSATRPFSAESGSALSGGASLEALLHASAPLYPLQESPFLNPGRVPPALSPALFFPLTDSDADPHREESPNPQGNHQTRPTSSSSTAASFNGRCGSAAVSRPHSSSSSLGRAMSAVRHTTSSLHRNFMTSSIAVAVSQESITDVVLQHRSWEGRDTTAKKFASQFARDVKRHQGSGGNAGAAPTTVAGGNSGGGKIAKLRLSQHKNPPLQIIGEEDLKMSQPVIFAPRLGAVQRPRSSSVMSSKAGSSTSSKPPMSRPASSVDFRPPASPVQPCEVPTAHASIDAITDHNAMTGASSLIHSSSSSPRSQSAQHNQQLLSPIEDRMASIAKQRLVVARVK